MHPIALRERPLREALAIVISVLEQLHPGTHPFCRAPTCTLTRTRSIDDRTEGGAKSSRHTGAKPGRRSHQRHANELKAATPGHNVADTQRFRTHRTRNSPCRWREHHKFRAAPTMYDFRRRSLRRAPSLQRLRGPREKPCHERRSQRFSRLRSRPQTDNADTGTFARDATQPGRRERNHPLCCRERTEGVATSALGCSTRADTNAGLDGADDVRPASRQLRRPPPPVGCQPPSQTGPKPRFAARTWEWPMCLMAARSGALRAHLAVAQVAEQAPESKPASLMLGTIFTTIGKPARRPSRDCCRPKGASGN